MKKEIYIVVSEDADSSGFRFEGVESSLEEARDYALTIAGTFSSGYEAWTPGKVQTSLGYYNVVETIGNKKGGAYWNVCIIKALVS